MLIPLAAGDWGVVWHNQDLRTRFTYVLLSAALERTFGFNPLPFYAASIVLHCTCVLLVYATGMWKRLNFSLTFWAACFFAIYEGHQEAVMWLAAANELLVVLFGLAAWICWVRRLQGGRVAWYAGSLVLFAAALASKESAVVYPVLMLIPVVIECTGRRRALREIAPFFGLAILFAAFTMAGRTHTDDRFVMGTGAAAVLVRSLWRLVFVWGLVAGAILLRRDRKIVRAAAAWMVLGLLPYSFLTYMQQVPSRATYLPSVGLAMLVGAAAWRLRQSNRRALLAVCATAALLFNLEILWVKKMAQYRERAEPSDLLAQAARDADGPIQVNCTRLIPTLVQAVLADNGARGAVQTAGKRDEHCFSIQYRNKAGQTVVVDRQLAAARHGAFY